jgi:Zn finger protein HypA/HybF involved in hydrogenase expression
LNELAAAKVKLKIARNEELPVMYRDERRRLHLYLSCPNCHEKRMVEKEAHLRNPNAWCKECSDERKRLIMQWRKKHITPDSCQRCGGHLLRVEDGYECLPCGGTVYD